MILTILKQILYTKLQRTKYMQLSSQKSQTNTSRLRFIMSL